MVRKLSGFLLASGAGALLVACATNGSGGPYADFDPADERAGSATERAPSSGTERAPNNATERPPNFTEPGCSGTVGDVVRDLQGICVQLSECIEDFVTVEPGDDPGPGEGEFEERRVSAWDGYRAVLKALPLVRTHADGIDPIDCSLDEIPAEELSTPLPFCVEDLMSCLRGILDLIPCGPNAQMPTSAELPAACERLDFGGEME